MGQAIGSRDMDRAEDGLKMLKPTEVSATCNRGWWEVEIFVEDGSYTGGKDRSYFGALLKAVDYAVKEQAKAKD